MENRRNKVMEEEKRKKQRDAKKRRGMGEERGEVRGKKRACERE